MNFIDNIMILGMPLKVFLFDKHLKETIAVFALAMSGFNWLASMIISILRARKLDNIYYENILTASKYYVYPDVIFEDPSHYSEPSETISKRSCMIAYLEKSFKYGATEKRILILGDAGLGKSALLLNLCKRHIYRMRQRYKMVYISLGVKEAINNISEIRDKADTVLLLDALDENVEAIQNYKETIEHIYILSSEFYRVIITCRTQFFSKQAEIPEIITYRSGAVSAGDANTGKFSKVYIAPLTPLQILLILSKTYIFNFSNMSIFKFEKSIAIVAKAPSLAVRPMLISYIYYLLKEKVSFLYSYQIYEAMIRSWLKLRRKSEILDPKYEDNLRFVYLLGRDIARHFSKRGGYHITREELYLFAKKYQINIADWQLDGRSLLNVDALGNYKFAHLSILEVLLARALIRQEDLGDWEVTDQAKIFLQEMQINETLADKVEGENKEANQSEKTRKYLINADFQKLDLTDKDFRRVDIRNAKMTESKLQGVDFSDSNIAGTNMEFADLSGSIFVNADLSKALFKGSNLSSARLENTNLQDADLNGADLSHAIFINCNLNDVHLLGADLTGTRFDRCCMERANLCNIRVQSNQDQQEEKIILADVNMADALVPSNFEKYIIGNAIGEAIHDKEPVDISHKLDQRLQDVDIVSGYT